MAVAGLSQAMRAALLDAHARTLGGLCFVICHEATRRALVARGLAVREDTGRSVRTVLTPRGVETAEQIRNRQETP